MARSANLPFDCRGPTPMSFPGIAEKVTFLSKPDNYPVPTQCIEIRETHMSWIFLTDIQAWKLKKPVRTSYLDFSTPNARRRNCAEEVRLNRRLAPDVYQGVVPLTIDPQGSLRIGGIGEAVDWLVCMRRLPADRMLDRAIADQSFSDTELRKVSALLARFYSQAQPVKITPAEYRSRLTVDVLADQSELIKPEYNLPVDWVESITDVQLEFLRRQAALFDARVRDGKIIEAHGDLRPEHICLEREPVIIDCLEFNRDFRILDTASELIFLAMECERLGAHQVGALILKTCCEQTGDWPPGPLLKFYKSYHGCLRAKIALWHLKDDGIHDQAKWTTRAVNYLRLAADTGSFA